MTIKELRILPPFAIGRLGSADEPLDNYTIEDAELPLSFRRIKGAPTLIVGETSGEILRTRTLDTVRFKKGGHIRPVAPFLEVFAVTEKNVLEPLNLELLDQHRLGPSSISWRISVANRKVVRRTGKTSDLVAADTGWFDDHEVRPLKGYCKNFIKRIPKPFVEFGHVRFIKPNEEFPGIRLRFTPAKGLIYGTHADPNKADEDPDPVIEGRAIYDQAKGWQGFGSEDNPAKNETVPPALFAIDPPAPSWLNNNIAVSRGYLDDACDGFVEVCLTLSNGKKLTAKARICSGPPALVPDALFVRNLADDLDQVINGPKVADEEPGEATRARALDIVRRAYETVRFMNVAVMNGNNFKGRPALDLDSMPQEEAADTERAIRPVMSAGTVDTLAIMTLHAQVYAALQGGSAPWFVRLLRQPEEVADFTDRGRRKMPALMCGADNSYLALTYRQIDTLRKAAEQSLFQPPTARRKTVPQKLTPRNLSAQLNYEAAGNPISSRPVTAVANCCPGLEVDFRAVWRRMFKGIVLREYDNLVVDIDPDLKDKRKRRLKGHRLLRVRIPLPDGNYEIIPVTTQIKGPASSDPNGEIVMTTKDNPHGLAPLEWSNALARVLSWYQENKDKKDKIVWCDFTKEKSESHQPCIDHPRKDRNYDSYKFEVRPFFEDGTAVISKALADAGELTQGLCSPWQNDYRECSCYYWASARPDYVNVEMTPSGLSTGDNWLQKKRTGDYVPDDYMDSRLILYDDLFEKWEDYLRYQVGGKDVPEEKELEKGDR
jgi:hypothetical protein